MSIVLKVTYDQHILPISGIPFEQAITMIKHSINDTPAITLEKLKELCNTLKNK